MSEQPPPSDPGVPPADPGLRPGAVPLAVPERTPHTVRLIVNDDLKRSRLTVFFRLLLLIPHLFWQYVWTFATSCCVIINWFAVLIMGRSPEDLHLFLSRALRYRTHLASYLFLVSNPYPTFYGRPGAHPVDLEIDGPDRQFRLVTLFRLLLAIPALVIAYVLVFVMSVVALIGWFVALVIGRMPKGMRDLSAYCLRYEAQTVAYLMVLTSRYPSFSGTPTT
jgi:hypothetical protein